MELDANLHHKSDLGEFWLSSDGIVHTYAAWVKPARLVEVIGQIPLPGGSVAEYREYMRRSIDFIRARNARINGYVTALDGGA